MNAFDWDIDHGDLARELSPDPTLFDHGTQLDDSIVMYDNSGTPSSVWPTTLTWPGCLNFVADYLPAWAGFDQLGDRNDNDAGEPDGQQRLDYLMTRNQPGRGLPERSHVFMKIEGESVYEEPWWSVEWNSDGTPPDGQVCGEIFAAPGTILDAGLATERIAGRLSDHAPVVTHLGLVRLREPRRYHAELPHTTTLRVTSADASNVSDCAFGWCNPLDLYTVIEGLVDGTTPAGSTTGSECEGWQVNEDTNACMSDWNHSIAGGGGDDLHEFVVELWDADTTSSNDELYCAIDENGVDSWIMARVNLLTQRFFIRSDNDQNITKFPSTGWYLENDEPYRWCSDNLPRPEICIEVTVEEQP